MHPYYDVNQINKIGFFNQEIEQKLRYSLIYHPSHLDVIFQFS